MFDLELMYFVSWLSKSIIWEQKFPDTKETLLFYLNWNNGIEISYSENVAQNKNWKQWWSSF